MARFFLGLACAAMASFPAAASPADNAGEARTAVDCGVTYTVAPGDSLYEIAKRFYRDGPSFGAIFEANREIIDRATFIDVGDTLFIPCLDAAGAGAATGPDEVARRIVEPTGSVDPLQPSPRLGAPEFGIAIASIILPSSRVELQSGGVMTDLALRALASSGRAEDFRLAFVDDRARHLAQLLPAGQANLSYPWFRPHCEEPGAVPPDRAALCRDYDFSRAFFEVTLSYFARAGTPLAAGVDDAALAGKVVCEPAGYLPQDLADAAGSTGSIAVRASSAGDCLRLLAGGEVDAVRLMRAEGEDQIARMGLGSELAEIAALRRSHTLHAVALKSDPKGRRALALLDDGLDRLMRSGGWFAVIAAHGPRAADRWARR